MSSKIAQWVGLIGIAATIPLVQTVAAAKSSVEINRIAKAITVLITSSKGQGSGVILQQQGDVYTVITAAHVVRKKVDYKITTPDDRHYEVISSSIRTSPGNIDLAVVKFKATNNYITAKLGNCNTIEGGMDIYLAGFPAPDEMITSMTFTFRKALVTANSNVTWKDGYSLMYDGNTLPGMSGGAVLNSDGELIAIHGKGDRNKDANGKNAEKNNYNAGISINRFQTVATKMGVELNSKIAPISPETTLKADDYYVSAAQKDDIGDSQGALTDYDRAIQLDPNYAYAYSGRGYLKYDKLNDPQGALADYNRSIQLAPNYAYAYNNRSLLKREKLNDIQGALADSNRAISIDPNLASAYNNRGILKYLNLNDSQGALADFNLAISIDPNNAYAYTNRGALKQRNDDSKGALADYSRAIQLSPNSARAYNNRGIVKHKYLGDPQGALADYDRAISIDPNFAGTYIDRGNLKYYGLEDRVGGINDMKQAARLFQQQGDTQSYQEVVGFLRIWQQPSKN
jgi:tetratricopeptide (TPR) repeat protein